MGGLFLVPLSISICQVHTRELGKESCVECKLLLSGYDRWNFKNLGNEVNDRKSDAHRSWVR